MVEPIQGEGGIIVPPKGWLAGVRRLCDHHNVMLIIDEVQTGLGRTGTWFAFQHENIRPDGLILGKALGGGVLPVSALVGTEELMGVFTPGSHGSTFGGNPLAAAVGLVALRVLEDENLIERCRELGEHMIARLRGLNLPAIKAVRGVGLLAGVEIDPAYGSARLVCERLIEAGVLSNETHETVIRLAPPLVIAKEDLDWAIDRIAEVIGALDPQEHRPQEDRHARREEHFQVA
jgi:ornithine--oxo-acid transaminase